MFSILPPHLLPFWSSPQAMFLRMQTARKNGEDGVIYALKRVITLTDLVHG